MAMNCCCQPLPNACQSRIHTAVAIQGCYATTAGQECGLYRKLTFYIVRDSDSVEVYRNEQHYEELPIAGPVIQDVLSGGRPAQSVGLTQIMVSDNEWRGTFTSGGVQYNSFVELSLPFSLPTLHAAMRVLEASYDMAGASFSGMYRSEFYSHFTSTGAIQQTSPGSNTDGPTAIDCSGWSFVPHRGVHVAKNLVEPNNGFQVRYLAGNVTGKLWFSKFSTTVTWCEYEVPVTNNTPGGTCRVGSIDCDPFVKTYHSGPRSLVFFSPTDYANRVMTVSCVPPLIRPNGSPTLPACVP